MPDHRYESERLLSERSGRRVLIGTDRWSGRAVVLKEGEPSSILREIRCLLQLPAGVGPTVLDLFRSDADRLVLVLEPLPGISLAQATPELTAAEVPPLVRAICHALDGVHRAGWIHSDLKPAHVFLVSGSDAAEVRLLDFGFALGRFRSWDEPPRPRGGTPAYIAPEIHKEWMVDERADLYSLGTLLADLTRSVDDEARWEPIVNRLTARIPARRYAGAREVSCAVAERFALPPDPADRPRW
ncbi:MAG: protein kinase, partial [Candidatus Eisenbacteria bacterium]|nr:protein kinase [Candidatus Latescibacterota bacterium]MBD3300829.1 protein kinase [Candidatus Eisenbacteria bacterium]